MFDFNTLVPDADFRDADLLEMLTRLAELREQAETAKRRGKTAYAKTMKLICRESIELEGRVAVANCNHRRLGSQSSAGRALDHCNGFGGPTHNCCKWAHKTCNWDRNRRRVPTLIARERWLGRAGKRPVCCRLAERSRNGLAGPDIRHKTR